MKDTFMALSSESWKLLKFAAHRALQAPVAAAVLQTPFEVRFDVCVPRTSRCRHCGLQQRGRSFDVLQHSQQEHRLCASQQLQSAGLHRQSQPSR